MPRLKRWESPRREGRNDKGRGGSARQRQRRKQFQALRQKLKDQGHEPNNGKQQNPGDRPNPTREVNWLPFFNGSGRDGSEWGNAIAPGDRRAA